ncbi:type VII secretion protein EccE [Klenkia soli]|uniref:Type VII secretion protein EccE n=1 Tax=Klenkia soli TaxID=1052260 RepID=A0A1H0TFA4_9ACTN|nr:type VII secretion protein EccE [Klenkia soli]SDP52742.1 type VII secretion protein EccE [Klenkia soli]
MTPPEHPPTGPRAAAARPAPLPPPPASAAYAERPLAVPAAAPAHAAPGAPAPAADAGWAGTAAAGQDLAGRGATSARATVGGLATAAPDAAVRAAAAAQARARAAAEREDGAPLAAAGAARRRPTPGDPRPRRRTRPGGLRPGQVVAVEVALVAGLVAHRQPWPVLLPVAVAVVLVLGLALARWSGRWAYQWAGLRLRHGVARRRRELPADATLPGTADALLDAVVHGGWLDQLDLDGVPAALWVHEGGLSVAVEVTATADRPYLTRSTALPPITSLLPAADEGGTRFTLQVLEQTHPAGLGEGPAALSYRELTGGAVPAATRCWVALQVLRGSDDETADLRTDLTNAARRVVRRLRKAGVRAVPLAPEDAVTGLLGLLGDAPAPPGAATRERWASWSAGTHRCVTAALDLPADHADDLPAALAELRGRARASGVTTMLAVAARRGDDGVVDVQVTLRAALPGGTDLPAGLTGPVGRGVLRRLDGQQRSGVAATLPLGGFLR